MIDLTSVPWEQYGIAGLIIVVLGIVLGQLGKAAILQGFATFNRMLDLFRSVQEAFNTFDNTLKESIKSKDAMTSEVRLRTKIIAQEFTEVKLGVDDVRANTVAVRDDLKLIEASHMLKHGELIEKLREIQEASGKNLSATDALLELLKDQRDEMNLNYKMQVNKIDEIIAAVTNLGNNTPKGDPELILPALPEGGESGNGRTGESPEPENIPTTPVI